MAVLFRDRRGAGGLSEVLDLRPADFDLGTRTVALRTLKQRKFHVREVPLPPDLLRKIDRCFGLSTMDPAERLWPISRTTAWRMVRGLLAEIGVKGPGACPKAIRHAFGVSCLHSQVPLTLVKKWLAHARLSTTEIYLDVVGLEEIAFAERLWREGSQRPNAQVGRSARCGNRR